MCHRIEKMPFDNKALGTAETDARLRVEPALQWASYGKHCAESLRSGLKEEKLLNSFSLSPFDLEGADS